MAQTQPGPITPQPPDPEFEQLLNVLNRGLSQIRDAVKEVDFGSSTSHAILSSDHTDIATGTVVRGDIIRGNSTPAWAKLGIGAANRALVSDGTDPAWAQLDHGAGLSGLGDDDHTQYVLHSILTTRGDIFFRNATTSARLAVGASAGMFLRSNATDPVWSTLVLPNSATINRIVYATAADTWGDNTNLTFDGTSFIVGTTGPHVIGGATAASTLFRVTGTFSPSVATVVGMLYDPTLSPGADSGNIHGFRSAATFVERAAGTHPFFAGISSALTITSGAAGLTTVAQYYADGDDIIGLSAAGAVNAACAYYKGPPVGATNNYTIWVDDGPVRLDTTTANGTVATAMSSLGPAGSNTTIQEWLTININGTVRYIPCF